jgi:hypothetical protein
MFGIKQCSMYKNNNGRSGPVPCISCMDKVQSSGWVAGVGIGALGTVIRLLPSSENTLRGAGKQEYCQIRYCIMPSIGTTNAMLTDTVINRA